MDVILVDNRIDIIVVGCSRKQLGSARFSGAFSVRGAALLQRYEPVMLGSKSEVMFTVSAPMPHVHVPNAWKPQPYGLPAAIMAPDTLAESATRCCIAIEPPAL